MTGLGLRHALGRSLSIDDGDGHQLATYNYGPEAPRSYFHPVAPPGAPPLSLRPHDHIWHTGLFFSWKYVDDTNFWEFGDGHVVSRDLAVTRHDTGGVRWTERNDWIRGSEDTPVLLREQRTIALCQNGPERSTIHWQSTFHTDRRRRLHSDPNRGYAGIGVRLIRDFQHKPHVLDAGGRNQPEEIRGAREPWVAWQGRYDSTLEWAGIALFEHPDNPDYPAPIFLGKNLSAMAFLGSGFLFQREHMIYPDRPLTLRYAFTIHQGEATTADYADWYEGYRHASIPAKNE